jgi:hypothetical protein
MQSTLTPEETDPHDMFVIEPDVVLAARVDKPAAHQTPPDKAPRDKAPASPAEDTLAEILSRPSTPNLHVVPDVSIAARVPPTKPVPPVNTTFRATAATADAIASGIKAPVDVKVPSDIRLNSARPSGGSWAKRAAFGFLFALGSVAAAEAWDHYGDTARQMMAVLTPVFTLPSSQPAATATQPAPATAAAAEQAAPQPAAAPAVEAAVTNQTPSPPAPGAIQPAPAAAAPPAVPDQTQALQSMTQDLAAMGQQIEALKATIAQLKVGQEQMAQQISRDMVRNAVVRNSEARPSEPRGRLSTRPVPPPVRKPVRATYAPAPSAAAMNLPPQPGPAYPPPRGAPAPMQVPPVATDPDGDLVVRPPMPLR